MNDEDEKHTKYNLGSWAGYTELHLYCWDYSCDAFILVVIWNVLSDAKPVKRQQSNTLIKIVSKVEWNFVRLHLSIQFKFSTLFIRRTVELNWTEHICSFSFTHFFFRYHCETLQFRATLYSICIMNSQQT